MDPSSMDLAALAKAILEAAMSKNFGLLAALAIWALVLLIRKFGPSIPVLGPILQKPLAGPLMAMLLSLTGYVGSAMLSGSPISIGGLIAVIANAWAASGFHELMQKTKEAAAKKATNEISNVIEADNFFKKEPPK